VNDDRLAAVRRAGGPAKWRQDDDGPYLADGNGTVGRVWPNGDGWLCLVTVGDDLEGCGDAATLEEAKALVEREVAARILKA
jgi:hypothetical protein